MPFVAIAGHPFGYEMSDAELDEFIQHQNRRAEWRFGEPRRAAIL